MSSIGNDFGEISAISGGREEDVESLMADE